MNTAPLATEETSPPGFLMPLGSKPNSLGYLVDVLCKCITILPKWYSQIPQRDPFIHALAASIPQDDARYGMPCSPDIQREALQWYLWESFQSSSIQLS